MRGRRIAEAPDGVGRHVRAHGCGLCTCKAHGRAVVEEVRGDVKFFDFGWSLLETREAKLKWGGRDRIVLRSKPS